MLSNQPRCILLLFRFCVELKKEALQVLFVYSFRKISPKVNKSDVNIASDIQQSFIFAILIAFCFVEKYMRMHSQGKMVYA